MSDTIAAVATAHGIGSIAIVRVSGPDALFFAKKVTHGLEPKPRYAHLASLYNVDDELIDQGLVIYFQAPKSFTGEEIVEFQCHGGIVVAQEILDTLLAYGARPASPGEFSKRAFLNGKIDLSEAEAIAKLIEAKSAEAAKILARQMKGELKRFVESTREALVRIMAYTEVTIDYADEDLPEDVYASIVSQLDTLLMQFRELVASSKRRKGLIEGFNVAIIGKPNVGKSSLLNALLSYERAIVSNIAGTTRDTVEEQVRIGSHLIRLIDTAGIRHADDEVERIGIERSIASLERADIIIALFDASRPFDDEDAYILKTIQTQMQNGKHVIIAHNKSDLPHVLDKTPFCDFEVLEVSAKRNFSLLTEKLKAILDETARGDELMLVSARQIDAVENATQAIEQARVPLERGELEFFAYHLQDALRALGSITRAYNNEEVLDAMFGEFCLGK
jgi:tRNA modification GTPase